MRAFFIVFITLFVFFSCTRGETKRNHDPVLSKVAELPTLDAESINRMINTNGNFLDLKGRTVVLQGKIQRISSKDDANFVIQLHSSFNAHITCNMKKSETKYRDELNVGDLTKIVGKAEIHKTKKFKNFAIIDALFVP